ncbi:PadR family transcriptional regulator [Paenibacillus sp. TRM 82003]|nr:PadR family transcriptional regulator [Paenibacillus sp. TRM 82003]
MARLMLLGLLRFRPMHGYEMQQLMLQSRMDLWANMLPGSIYYALNKMEEEGLVRTAAEERTGARMRKIYGITERGEEAFREELRKALVAPPHSVKSDFSVAVALIEGLPKEEALALLEENAAAVRAMLDAWRAGQAAKAEAGISQAVQLTFDNGIARMELDLAYLDKLIALLRA